MVSSVSPGRPVRSWSLLVAFFVSASMLFAVLPGPARAGSARNADGNRSAGLTLGRASGSELATTSQQPFARYDMNHLRYRLMLTGALGTGVPSGTWFDGFSSGMATNLAGRLALTGNLFIGVAFQRQDLGVKNNPSYVEVQDDYGYWHNVKLDIKAHLQETYFLIGANSIPRRETDPIGYGELGIGPIKHTIEATASLESVSASQSTDETKVGVLLGAGAIIPLGESVGVIAQGDMRITGSGETSSDESTSSTGILFGLRAGLALMLGH